MFAAPPDVCLQGVLRVLRVGCHVVKGALVQVLRASKTYSSKAE